MFKAAIALQQTFSKLIRKGKFLPGGPKDGAKGAAEELSKWLREQYRTYQSHLLALLQHDEPRIQLTALDALMHLLKVESSKQQPADQYARFDNDAYLRIVRAALDNGNLNEHLQEQLLELAVAYHDLRYYTYADLATICPKLEAPSEQTLEAILSLLTMDPPLPKTAAEIDTFYALTTGKPPKTLAELPSFRKAYSQAWLAFLRLPMPVNVHKTVLLAIDSFAIPNLSDPNLLIDYLTSAVDAGGVQAVLGLSGLFTLIHKHNLWVVGLVRILRANPSNLCYFARFQRLSILLSSSLCVAHPRTPPNQIPPSFLEAAGPFPLLDPSSRASFCGLCQEACSTASFGSGARVHRRPSDDLQHYPAARLGEARPPNRAASGRCQGP